jgi:gamma-glutamyltranspeptidase/glutathione hydrolase
MALARDTSYACAMDADGNVFSATPSDGSSSGPLVPGTGLVPSTRGSQSRPDQSHVASIAPGKRPRLTPTPGLALRGESWAMPFGTPGGDVQCQAMAQTLLNVTVFGMNPQAAVEAPRFSSFSFPNSFAPHDYHPGLLKLEGRFDADTVAALEAKGHRIEYWEDADWRAGAVCMIEGDLENGVMTAGADFRRPASAAGW